MSYTRSMFKPAPVPAHQARTDEKLDRIIAILDRMNRRDRLRTIGGFLRGILGLIPIAILLGSVWYVVAHGDDVLRKITEQAARQAAELTGSSADKLLKQYMNR